MLFETPTSLALFGGGTGLLAAFSQLVTKDKRVANYNLMVLHLTLGLLMFQCASVFTGYCLKNPWVLCYHLTLIWVQAPLLYVAHYYLANTDELNQWKIFLLFVPSILAFILDTASIFAYIAGVIPSLLWIFHDDVVSWLIIKKYLLIAGTIQIIIYLTVFIKNMYPAWRESEKNSILTITLIYAAGSILSASFLLAGYVTINLIFLGIASSITSSQIILIPPVAQRYPRFLHILQTEVKRERYKKYLLAGKNVKLIEDLLVAMMEDDKLYRDEELTLKILADRVAMTPHQLSQLLNDKLNTTFRNFVNHYRINEAEYLLVEKPDMPVLAIAFEVGFNNKSSFYEAFSKFNGITPYKYRKNKTRKRPGS